MASEQRTELPSAYGTLQVGIAVYDPETGTILDANERLESMTGYTTDELREIPIERYTANTYSFAESEFLDRLRASAAGSPQQFTWRIKRGDGELIWARIYLSPYPLEDRTGVRAEIRDVTDYYQTSHREELFWRILRHNLRNEATIIRGNARHIHSDESDADVRAAAETIESRAEELGEIAESVQEIQAAVEQSTDRRTYRNAAVAAEAVAADVLADRPAGEITVEERESMWIHVDSAFTHALTHALENAIIHSDEADPSVEVVVGPSPNTGRVDIRINDTNPPIPAAELDAVFDRRDTTSTYHGSGVGLFVMKWCIESLGGEIEFERRPTGNTVHFYFPPKDPPEDVA